MSTQAVLRLTVGLSFVQSILVSVHCQSPFPMHLVASDFEFSLWRAAIVDFNHADTTGGALAREQRGVLARA